MIPLVQILTRTEAYLRERGVDSPRLEAELLLCHVLKMERLQLYLAHDRPMAEDELQALRPLVGRRGKREPLAWILGTQAFHNLELAVAPGVLVPRPDTETLVNAALSFIPEHDDEPVYVADIGAGTGAVGLAIAHARSQVRLYATEIGPDPLKVARQNLNTLGLQDRAVILEGPYLDPIPAHRPIDWVVSNPPYIPTSDLEALMPEVRDWEPRLALDGGPDGLDCYRTLIPKAAQRARKGVLVEVGIRQAGHIAVFMRKAGLHQVQTWDDLAGIPRVVGGLVP